MTRAVFSIVLMASALIYCDAKITAWTNPPITDPATGKGTATPAIPENIAIGETGVIIAATSETSTLEITYSIISAPGIFSINSSSGAISINSALDFETTAAYTITVKADDTKGNATANVTLTIDNVNPEFSQDQTSTCVADGAVAKTKVTTVTAHHDKTTSTDVIVYKITEGDSKKDFAIDGKGEITVANTLDKAKTPSYTLKINAQIGGSGGDTMDVKVKVGCSTAALTSPLNILAIIVAAILSLYQ